MDPISTQLLSGFVTGVEPGTQTYDGALAIGTPNVSPYVTVYPFTKETGFGTKYSNPSSISYNGAFVGGGIKFTKDGLGLVYTDDPAGATGAPAVYGIVFYKWTNALGFGSRVTSYTSAWAPYGPGGPITTKPSEYVDFNGQLYHYVVHSYYSTDRSPQTSWLQKTLFGPMSPVATYTSQRDTGQTGVKHTELTFNKGGTYLLGLESSMYIRAYPWTDQYYSNSSTSSANIAAPLEAFSQGTGWSYGAWHPTDSIAIVAKGSSTGLRAITFSGGWGVTLNDATSPMSEITGVKVSPSGKTVFICSTNSPYIEAYSFDSTSGFGSKFSNPASLPSGPCYDITVGKTNDVVAVVSTSFPYVTAYPWDDNTGFGTKYSNPGTSPPGSSYALAFM